MSLGECLFAATLNILTKTLILVTTRVVSNARAERLKQCLKTIQQALFDVYYSDDAFEADQHNDDRRFVDIASIQLQEDRDYYVLDDIPVMVDMPKYAFQYNVGGRSRSSYDCLEPLVMLPVTPLRYQFNPNQDLGTMYLMSPASSTTKCSPNFYDSNLLTPVRYSMRQDVTFALLKAASDRVTEILRENRRRLDAGEDPCALRRELRRRRAHELSALRKKNKSPFCAKKAG